MPLEEAQKVISDYTPPAKERSAFPAALEVLYQKIQDKNRPITLDEYLKLKYPEADEEELRTDRVRDQDRLQEACEIDKTCAVCTNPDKCPFNRKRGRPVVMLKYGRLDVGATLTMPCKYDAGKPDPEVENRIKKSGLSSSQVKQTFAAYDHSGSEAAVAKAKAILAAKKKHLYSVFTKYKYCVKIINYESI